MVWGPGAQRTLYRAANWVQWCLYVLPLWVAEEELQWGWGGAVSNSTIKETQSPLSSISGP